MDAENWIFSRFEVLRNPERKDSRTRQVEGVRI